jgi:ATPase subunit of ABC transporter with duplicated ATPase domains
VHYGSRIAIIGRNGSGKSTLLKILYRKFEATSGDINIPEDVTFGYVPQVINEFDNLSGGQRLNEAITSALNLKPNILLLDEPTNHLDTQNRKSLMRMLQNYAGTLIVVSHDTELLRNCIDTLWHIDNGQIQVFSGNYDNYIHEVRQRRISIEQELSYLNHHKKNLHEKLMQEQQRTAKSKASGERNVANRKWTKMTGDLKAMKAEKSQSKKLKAIDHTKQHFVSQLSNLRLPEIITPTFSLNSADVGDRTIVSINDGSIGYASDRRVLSNINLAVSGKDRFAIIGDNGSGKSTLVKGILNDPSIFKEGEWFTPKRDNMGYLDQHYSTLDPNQTVFEAIAILAPYWSYAEVRRHLNDFLFRKNEEINAYVSTLSGGEKARLSLAQIAAKTPKLLILDEITNNLDLETKDHVAQILQNYPGAIIIISHDADFLKEIGISEEYKLNNVLT